jgi:hypothetical protein
MSGIATYACTASLFVRFGSKGDMKALAEYDRFAANSGHLAALSQRSNRNRKCRTGLSAIEPSVRQKIGY